MDKLYFWHRLPFHYTSSDIQIKSLSGRVCLDSYQASPTNICRLVRLSVMDICPVKDYVVRTRIGMDIGHVRA